MTFLKFLIITLLFLIQSVGSQNIMTRVHIRGFICRTRRLHEPNSPAARVRCLCEQDESINFDRELSLDPGCSVPCPSSAMIQLRLYGAWVSSSGLILQYKHRRSSLDDNTEWFVKEATLMPRLVLQKLYNRCRKA
jgi:hypothetical protein